MFLHRLSGNRKSISIVLSVVLSVLFVVLVVEAATTISTSIVTGGALTVSDATTLNGDVTLGDAAGDAIILIGNASTTNALTVGSYLYVETTASTTNLIVGGDSANGTIAGMVFGYCSFNSGTITASTTKAVDCANANGVRIDDRVFVQATSSLGTNFVIIAASSSAANTISLYITNLALTAGDASTGQISIDFFSIR